MGQASAQCHLVFAIPVTCINGGADALVRSRPLGRLAPWCKDLILLSESGTRASRADQGVCPTNGAAFPVVGKLSGIVKLRGIKGSGTYKVTGNPDGSGTVEIEGDYTLAAPAAAPKK